MSFLKKKIRSSKGQSLVEVLVLSLILTTLIPMLMAFFWIGTNILWIEHQLYQGLFCTAQQKPIEFCRSVVLKQIKKLSLLGSLGDLKISQFQNEWKGEIRWHFYKKDFVIRQKLSLPK